MSKKILALAVLVMMLFAMSCDGGNNDNGGNNLGDGGEMNGNNNVEELNENGEFVYKGKVTSVDSDHHIEMEIIDSQVAFGTYWVLVSNQTVFVDGSGATISRSDVKAGDTIEVVFSGQVMMSYPPQIAAQKIILK